MFESSTKIAFGNDQNVCPSSQLQALYLLVATPLDICNRVYGKSQSIGGQKYLSIAIGFIVELVLNFTAVDRIHKAPETRNNGAGVPRLRGRY